MDAYWTRRNRDQIAHSQIKRQVFDSHRWRVGCQVSTSAPGIDG